MPEVLSIDKSASGDEVKKAYRKVRDLKPKRPHLGSYGRDWLT